MRPPPLPAKQANHKHTTQGEFWEPVRVILIQAWLDHPCWRQPDHNTIAEPAHLLRVYCMCMFYLTHRVIYRFLNHYLLHIDIYIKRFKYIIQIFSLWHLYKSRRWKMLSCYVLFTYETGRQKEDNLWCGTSKPKGFVRVQWLPSTLQISEEDFKRKNDHHQHVLCLLTSCLTFRPGSWYTKDTHVRIQTIYTHA